MEEVMSMNVVQSRKYLIEDAFHASYIHAFMISRLHELIEIAVHVFHTYVKFLSVRVEKYVESSD